MRLVAAAVAGWFGLVACPLSSQAAESLPPDAQVFTLAGGGAAPARDGAVATDVRLGLGSANQVPVVALEDGSVVTIDAHADPIRITRGGVVRRLPRLPGAEGVGTLIGLADGSLVAVQVFTGVIYRLTPGAPAWIAVIHPDAVGGQKQASAPGPLPEGGFAFGVENTVWRINVDGTFMRWGPELVPRERSESLDTIGSVRGLADGSLAIVRRAPIGTARRVVVYASDGAMTASVPMPMPELSLLAWVPDPEAGAVGLEEMPGSGLVRAARTVDLITGPGAPRPLAGHRPGYGLGDGGAAEAALLHAGSVARAPDGALVLGDANPLGGDASLFGQPAAVVDGDLFTVGFNDASRMTPLVRVVVPRDTTRRLAALAPQTYTSVRTGRIVIRSTTAGTATVIASAGRGKVLASARRSTRHGDTTLTLSHRLPRRAVRVRMTLITRGGQRIVTRSTMTTERRLTVVRARQATASVTAQDEEVDEGGGYRYDPGRCRPRSRARVDCQIIETFTGERERRVCGGVARVELRPDGVRVGKTRGAKRCRTLGS